MKVALVGQPNSGKSTLFNAAAGYRSLTSNFAGTTVEYTLGQARIGGEVVDLIDLPGLYSLTPTSPVEEVSRDYLLGGDWDVVINVVDASQLARSLELTLELLDLEAPLVVCLNMMDEAVRKGMTIDTPALSRALGVPVIEAIGTRGRGINETFAAARQAVERGGPGRAYVYAAEVEDIIDELSDAVEPHLPRRAVPAVASRLTSGRRAPTLAPAPVNAPACAGGGCTGCGAAPVAGTGSQAKPPAGVFPVATTAVIDDEPEVASPNGQVQITNRQSSMAIRQSAIPAFPPARFRALQWVQSDPRKLRTEEPTLAPAVERAQAAIAARTHAPADAAVSRARHAACLGLFEETARLARPRADWREQVDRLAMHPIWGYAVLALVFTGFFRLIFDVGKLGEDRILSLFDLVIAALTRHMDAHSALFAGVKGAVLGTAGAVAIVLPYLLPFLVGLAILEDIGYLSRVGYLMDALMHRLGLHGTATLPVLIGYGCSVPAVMGTRILSTRRDRFIGAFLAIMVPCSARMTVIFALVGFYLGAGWALGIYALNLLIVAVTGHILARMWPEVSPGMLMEVPAYRVPGPRVVVLKTWWRLREFVLVAFPMLVGGSVLLSLIDFYGWQHGINAALGPLMSLLGLPHTVGLTLIFGVLRKELSLLMLMQALGTTHVATVMTTAQILIFTLFVTFYVPCVATLASMKRELGWRLTLAASGALLGLAVVVSVAARGLLRVL